LLALVADSEHDGFTVGAELIVHLSSHSKMCSEAGRDSGMY
jgi:hypothetical protein